MSLSCLLSFGAALRLSLCGSPALLWWSCVPCCSHPVQSFAGLRNICTAPDYLPTDAPKFLAVRGFL